MPGAQTQQFAEGRGVWGSGDPSLKKSENVEVLATKPEAKRGPLWGQGLAAPGSSWWPSEGGGLGPSPRCQDHGGQGSASTEQLPPFLPSISLSPDIAGPFPLWELLLFRVLVVPLADVL